MKNAQFVRRIKVDTINSDQPLGRYLILLLRTFERDLLEGVGRAGFTDVTLSDLQILHFIRPEGSLATEISALAGITKQAVGKSVASLEKRRYVARKRSLEDSRGKTVAFTSRGMKLLDEGVTVIRNIERRYLKALGIAEYERLRTSLATLINLHTPPAEVSKRPRRSARD